MAEPSTTRRRSKARRAPDVPGPRGRGDRAPAPLSVRLRKILLLRFTRCLTADRPSSVAWASFNLGNHRRPHDARVTRSRPTSGKPQVAYRETIRKHAEGGTANTSGQTGAVAPVASTVTRRFRLDPNEPGKGIRVHQRHHRRIRAQGIHQADRSGHAGSHGRPAFWPVYPDGRHQGDALRTAAITDVELRTKWHSRCAEVPTGIQGSCALSESGDSRSR